MRKWFAALTALLILCIPALAFGPASETVHGIDVSVYNGHVDFAARGGGWHPHGIYPLFAGIFLCRPYSGAQADGARDAGLEFGFYHFCTASTEEEAVRQARFLLKPISPATTIALKSRNGVIPPRANSTAPKQPTWRLLS